MTKPHPGDLVGRTILVVEDDYMLAQDITRAFKHSGAEILGPVSNVADALDLLETATALDGAVLDINLMGEMVYPVADALKRRSVPFVFATGYDMDQMPMRFDQVTCFQKPIDPNKLADALFR